MCKYPMLVNVGFSYCVSDNQQITFVMLSGFCLLSKNLPSSLFLTDNNKLHGTQTKNTCPFYIVFLVLNVFLIKVYKIAQAPILFYFLLFYISFYICRYNFS